jgi:hypothetical protein
MIRSSLIGVLAILLGYVAWISTDPIVNVKEKINGVSLVSPPRPVHGDRFDEIAEINANWVAIIPFAFSREGQPRVTFNHPKQWWGEKKEGVSELTKYAHERQLNVMFKPHVWVKGQGWAGDFDLLNEEDWLIWEESYSDYILHHARLADSLGIQLFCIGTEYCHAVVKRAQFWESLVVDVRQVYHGQLTYAANWDNYQNVTFWDQLDYVGVDAYFPLETSDSPELDDLKMSWNTEFENLKAFSKSSQKPILFTEFGYQSIKGTHGKHWELEKENLDLEAQRLAYQALFETFWDKKWYAGGFFWKWHMREGAGGVDNANFTPQGKPALDVIQKHFSSSIRNR